MGLEKGREEPVQLREEVRCEAPEVERHDAVWRKGPLAPIRMLIHDAGLSALDVCQLADGLQVAARTYLALPARHMAVFREGVGQLVPHHRVFLNPGSVFRPPQVTGQALGSG